jgi:hypothetical protein
MSWTCAEIEERLSDHLDGLLTPEERLEFEAHVAGCSRCAPLIAQVGSLVGRMHALEPLEEPPALVSKILDHTLGPRTQAQAGWAKWIGWLRPVSVPRFAMGALTVVASFFIVFSALGVNTSKMTAADLNPLNVFHNANRRAHLVYSRGVKFVNDLRVVYEIQTRLRPEATPPPAPEEQQAPPRPNPQQKSEHETKPGRSANRYAAELAVLLTTDPGGEIR